MKSISIGEMVQLVLRSGDIDSRASSGPRMEEGQRVHRLLQGAYGDGWEKEVGFKKSFDALGILIQGRADGVFERRLIHEIKSTRCPLADWDSPGYEVHWAQAICYAYILAESEGLEAVEILLTYYNDRTEERKDLSRTHTLAELTAYVEDLITRYAVWHQLQVQWALKRNAGLQAMPFPYGGYRSGQRKLAASVYTAIRDGFIMLAEAPTGVGKTISTLFPALKAMGEDHVDKIFYLTAKTVVRAVAEDAARDMRRAGGLVKTLTLTAKDKLCFTGEKKCNPVDCSYAKGHFDRINDCILDALQHQDHMDRDQVIFFAEKHHVCPFEFSFDMATFSDVVICDYNHVFDPLVKIQRFFGEVNERYAFLVDEAHNLPSRARDMFSSQVVVEELSRLRKAFPRKSAPYRELGKLTKTLKEAARDLHAQGKEYLTDTLPSPLICSQVRKSFDSASAYLADTEGFELPSDLSEIMINLYRFDTIFDLFSGGYLWLESTEGGGTARLMCIDPSELLKTCYGQGVSTVIFSATMAPYPYYEEVLGLDGCPRLVLESPFPRENRLMLHGGGIDTRLQAREGSYEPIADYIEALVQGRQANYLVFFPSYSFMNRIADILAARDPAWVLHPQKPGMTEAEKTAFLSVFESEGTQTIIGLAVLGGSFSEGIDLSGSRLEGVAIVGLGTPYVSMENTIIQQYYDRQQKDGYTYAFVYPAINKVVQAVGRLIRTETDRGVVLMLDDRYQSRRYQRLFPQSWHLKGVHRPEEVHGLHLGFWR